MARALWIAAASVCLMWTGAAIALLIVSQYTTNPSAMQWSSCFLFVASGVGSAVLARLRR